MAFHFLSHPWEVRYVSDGIVVACTRKDLDAMTVPALVDELHDLVLENGVPNLYLDFARVDNMASAVVGKLLALDARLRKVGGRLSLRNVDPALYEALRGCVGDSLEMHMSEYQPV